LKEWAGKSQTTTCPQQLPTQASPVGSAFQVGFRDKRKQFAPDAAPREGTMKKNQALKFLNPALGMLVLSQAITSSLHDFFPKELFEVIHGGGGILLVSGVALHLYFNWSWVRATYLNKSGPQSS